MSKPYDLIIVGAGSAGLTAAEFGASLGARVALVERQRIGGDCTWYGCVPSKALLHVAKTVKQARSASRFGLKLSEDRPVDMSEVRNYIDEAIAEIYQWETPEHLAAEGIDVVQGNASFVDPYTIQVGERQLRGKNFLIATGATPFIPPIPGLKAAAYHTNKTIFANERLPHNLITIGAGPIGLELSQSYRYLGADVTVVDVDILPNADPAVSELMANLFRKEGIKFVPGLVEKVSAPANDLIELTVDGTTIQGDMLLVAVGRRPSMAGLRSARAGVNEALHGLEVNESLQTNVPHIYGAGDCLGGPQFTHYAGWQGFQAARNALLPGNDNGFTKVLPWAIYSSPEIAQVGLNEVEAQHEYAAELTVLKRPLGRVDRAVTDDDLDGFIKVMVHKGKVVGATIVAERAGEMITEFALAMKNDLTLRDLASTLHAYPSYSMGMQRLLAEEATAAFVGSGTGRFLRRLKGYT